MALEVNENAMDKLLRIVPDQMDPSLMYTKENKIPDCPVKIVYPSPGACIKTWLENGEKVFINVCISKDILPPEDISDEKLADVILDEANSCGYVIPLALGVEKRASDKDGIERMTFDVLMNTDYFEKCMKKEYFWIFTVKVILGSISEKYDMPITLEKYVILKNRKAIGTLQPFRIEQREIRKPQIKKPLIEVLNSKEDINQSKIKSSAADNVIKNHIFLRTKSPENKDVVLGYFQIPSKSFHDIEVDIAKNRVIVEDSKIKFLSDNLLPYVFDENIVTAKYDSSLQILQLTLPLKT